MQPRRIGGRPRTGAVTIRFIESPVSIEDRVRAVLESQPPAAECCVSWLIVLPRVASTTAGGAVWSTICSACVSPRGGRATATNGALERVSSAETSPTMHEVCGTSALAFPRGYGGKSQARGWDDIGGACSEMGVISRTG